MRWPGTAGSPVAGRRHSSTPEVVHQDRRCERGRMAQKSTLRYEDLSKAQLKRLAIRLVARSLAVAVLLFTGYYVLPMNRPERSGLVVLVVGLLVLGLVLAWQVHAIMGSPFPRAVSYTHLT